MSSFQSVMEEQICRCQEWLAREYEHSSHLLGWTLATNKNRIKFVITWCYNFRCFFIPPSPCPYNSALILTIYFFFIFESYKRCPYCTSDYRWFLVIQREKPSNCMIIGLHNFLSICGFPKTFIFLAMWECKVRELMWSANLASACFSPRPAAHQVHQVQVWAISRSGNGLGIVLSCSFLHSSPRKGQSEFLPLRLASAAAGIGERQTHVVNNAVDWSQQLS